MTASQSGLLFETALAGDSAVNVLQVIVDFRDEPLRPKQMLEAWQDLTDHHAVLRLVMDPSGPMGAVQGCRAAVRVDFEQLALQIHPAQAAEARFDDWLARDRSAAIGFDQAPCWRIRLLDMGAEGQRMVWTFHHALLDGNGYRLLLAEWGALYAARRVGLPLPPLKTAGNGFLQHCRVLPEADHSGARAFFATHLAEVAEPAALPPGFAADKAATPSRHSSRMISTQLDITRSKALRQRAEAAGCSMADLMAVTWAMVLARVSGRGEALLGITRSGRHLLPGHAPYAGCCIITLPCRIQLNGRGIAALLRDQRAFALAARPHEHAPLAEVMRQAGDRYSTALFDSLLLFERHSLPEAMRALGPEWAQRSVEERSEMATPLLLAVSDDAALMIRLEHQAAHLSPDGADRLLGYFENLLQAIAESSGDTPLDQLDMLPSAERAALLALAQPERPITEAPDIVAAIRAAAARWPAQIAVEQIGQDGGLLYADLLAEADRLAARLAHHGFGPGSRVAIALPRAAAHVVALLGVLISGAAFLPLDASYPPDVLQDAIDRAGAEALITSAPLARYLLPQSIPVLLVDGDHDPAALAAPGTDHLPPDAPAYVIFTSGSTGAPKAVSVSRGAISAHALAAIRAFALLPEDRVLQFASLNFDVALEEILPTLCTGARLVLRNDAVLESVPAFLQALQAHRISLANLPTAFWQVLVAGLEPRPPALPPSLRLLVVGGEKVSPEALRRWRKAYPTLPWLNGYGPTETTITATLYAPGAVLDPDNVPIGRPMAHCRAYVLAADGSLAPQGAQGELCIGGAGVALGYLDQPALTAQSFPRDPFQPEPLRMYRSGDRAAWRSDGQLAYHGRADRQLKLRGYRIEPGGIETLLERQTEVVAARVDLDQPGAVQARLLAWLHLLPEALTQDATALRQRLMASLAAILPPPMMPQLILRTAFPITPNGKLDMAALRAEAQPTADFAPEVNAVTPPRLTDPRSQKICAIFANLLGQERVGPDQSFFDLGGNSLLSLQLTGQLQRAFGRNLPLASLYQAQTPRRIAAALRQADAVTNCIVQLQPKGDAPPLFVVHILGPNGAFFRPMIRRLGLDQPVLGLTVDLLDPSTPNGVEEIAALYCQNIVRHWPEGPVHLMAISQGAYIAYEIAQQLALKGREVAGLYLLDSAGPGGRPRQSRQKSLKHYALRLRHNLHGVLSAYLTHIRVEAQFRLEKLRLRLSRHLDRPAFARSSTATAHQAAIDLAISDYRLRRFDGPLIVYRATAHSRDTAEGIATCLGWAQVAARAVVIDTPGDHLTILEDPHVASFCADLQSRLSDAPSAP